MRGGVSGNSDLHVELLTKYGGWVLAEASGVALLVLAVWGFGMLWPRAQVGFRKSIGTQYFRVLLFETSGFPTPEVD